MGLVRFRVTHKRTNIPLSVKVGEPIRVSATREVNQQVHTVGFGKYDPRDVLRVSEQDGEAVLDFLNARFGDKWRFEVIDDASGKTYGELLEEAEAASLDAEDAVA